MMKQHYGEGDWKRGNDRRTGAFSTFFQLFFIISLLILPIEVVYGQFGEETKQCKSIVLFNSFTRQTDDFSVTFISR
jgi:hypothetical protein